MMFDKRRESVERTDDRFTVGEIKLVRQELPEAESLCSGSQVF